MIRLAAVIVLALGSVANAQWSTAERQARALEDIARQIQPRDLRTEADSDSQMRVYAGNLFQQNLLLQQQNSFLQSQIVALQAQVAGLQQKLAVQKNVVVAKPDQQSPDRERDVADAFLAIVSMVKKRDSEALSIYLTILSKNTTKPGESPQKVSVQFLREGGSQ